MKNTTRETVRRVWGVRAGKGGKAHGLFLEHGVIALEDAGLRSLSTLHPTRDAFYAAYRRLHPDETRSGSANSAGKFFRFTHDVVIGDLVVYPALSDKQVYVGTVNGPYDYCSTSDYPHQRSVEWNYVIPKCEFSQAAVYELGAARTFFEFKRHTNELLSRLCDKSVTRVSH